MRNEAQFESQNGRRSRGWKLVRTIAMIGAAATLYSMWPDLKRYVKIERM